jgi:hypothetical protein
MLKKCRKLKFLANRLACELSILAVNVLVVARGLRKSSSLTNGIGRARNKAPLKEYGTEARGLHLSCNLVRAPILGTSADALSTAPRRRH